MGLTAEQIAQINAIASGGAAPPADGQRVTPQINAAPAAPPAAASTDVASLVAAAAKAGAEAAIAAMGHGAAPAAQAPRPTYQRPLGPPASDGGGPAAPARNLDGVSLFSMTEADRAHVIREKGLDWYMKTLREQSRGTTVKLR